MAGEFDRERVIRFLRLAKGADDAGIARAIRGMARKHGGMRRQFDRKSELDPIHCLAAVNEHLNHELRAATRLDEQIDALIEKKKKMMSKTNLRILALNLVRFACHTPEKSGSEE